MDLGMDFEYNNRDRLDSVDEENLESEAFPEPIPIGYRFDHLTRRYKGPQPGEWIDQEAVTFRRLLIARALVREERQGKRRSVRRHHAMWAKSQGFILTGNETDDQLQDIAILGIRAEIKALAAERDPMTKLMKEINTVALAMHEANRNRNLQHDRHPKDTLRDPDQ